MGDGVSDAEGCKGMMELMTGGAVGLMLGIGLQRCGLTARDAVRRNMALHRRNLLRRVLMLAGWATVLTAFLCWLAVIDVDRLQILPLNAGTLAGAVLFGAAAGMTGLLPGTVPGSIGGGRFVEGVCALAGCALGTVILRMSQPLLNRLQGMLLLSDATLFQVTLDKPYLLPGGFLAQGCVGGALMLAALLIPKDPAAVASAPAETEAPVPEVSLEAEDVQADTVIALLPGEEPLTVDTAAQEAPAEESPVEETPPATADAEEDGEASPQEEPAEEMTEAAEAPADAAEDADKDDHLG